MYLQKIGEIERAPEGHFAPLRLGPRSVEQWLRPVTMLRGYHVEQCWNWQFVVLDFVTSSEAPVGNKKKPALKECKAHTGNVFVICDLHL